MNLPIKIQLPEDFFHEEERYGYTITAQAKQLWAVLLDLLVEFDRVCRQHNIKYALDSGTFLGAVRHKGFIPWDNDLDVIMLREEYDKLCRIGHKAFLHPYFWQTPYSDVGSCRRHGQLRNSLTTYILNSETQDGNPAFSFNQGIFLDVFILDEVPDDTTVLKQQQEKMVGMLPIMWDFKQYYLHSNQSEWIADALYELQKRFDHLSSQYNGTHQKRIGNISLIPDRKEERMLPRHLYDNLAEYDFEGFHFPAPADYETYLGNIYGDWHKFVMGGEMHDALIIDTQRPYTEYLHRTETADATTSHPLIQLYEHRDQLLQQRDEAWDAIKAYSEDPASPEPGRNDMLDLLHAEIDLLRRKRKKYKNLFCVFLTAFLVLLAWLLVGCFL